MIKAKSFLSVGSKDQRNCSFLMCHINYICFHSFFKEIRVVLLTKIVRYLPLVISELLHTAIIEF